MRRRGNFSIATFVSTNIGTGEILLGRPIGPR
jgi:hypothetical protein